MAEKQKSQSSDTRYRGSFYFFFPQFVTALI
jgi:hypothetical protein